MTDFHVLVVYPEQDTAPEVCSDPTQSRLPEWVEGKLQTDRAYYEPLGKRMGVWWERNGVGSRNDRACALWYGVATSDTGSVPPVPPAFLGSVVVEADDGQLPHSQLLLFLDSGAARSFAYGGRTPEPEVIQSLVRAWRAAGEVKTPNGRR